MGSELLISESSMVGGRRQNGESYRQIQRIQPIENTAKGKEVSKATTIWRKYKKASSYLVEAVVTTKMFDVRVIMMS